MFVVFVFKAFTKIKMAFQLAPIETSYRVAWKAGTRISRIPRPFAHKKNHSFWEWLL